MPNPVRGLLRLGLILSPQVGDPDLQTPAKGFASGDMLDIAPFDQEPPIERPPGTHAQGEEVEILIQVENESGKSRYKKALGQNVNGLDL